MPGHPRNTHIYCQSEDLFGLIRKGSKVGTFYPSDALNAFFADTVWAHDLFQHYAHTTMVGSAKIFAVHSDCPRTEPTKAFHYLMKLAHMLSVPGLYIDISYESHQTIIHLTPRSFQF